MQPRSQRCDLDALTVSYGKPPARPQKRIWRQGSEPEASASHHAGCTSAIPCPAGDPRTKEPARGAIVLDTHPRNAGAIDRAVRFELSKVLSKVLNEARC